MGKAIAVFAAVFHIGLAIFAVSVLRQDIRNSDVILLGQQIGAGQVVAPDAVLKVLSAPNRQSLLETCRTDILRLGLVSHVSALDIQNARGDAAQLQQSVQEAREFMGHMERCNPANGDVWLRDAMVSRAFDAGQEQAFRTKIMLSAALIPNYGHEVSARLSLWGGMSKDELDSFSNIVLSDLSVGLNYFDKVKARRLLAYSPPSLQPYTIKALGLVPKARIADLISR